MAGYGPVASILKGVQSNRRRYLCDGSLRLGLKQIFSGEADLFSLCRWKP